MKKMNETLEALLQQARLIYDAMSPEEKAEHDRKQRESWMRGEMALGLDDARYTSIVNRPERHGDRPAVRIMTTEEATHAGFTAYDENQLDCFPAGTRLWIHSTPIPKGWALVTRESDKLLVERMEDPTPVVCPECGFPVPR